MNNGFEKRRYSSKDTKTSDMLRHIDWIRGNPYTFTINDKEELLSSNNLFARKFSTSKDTDIINLLQNVIYQQR